MKRVTRRRPAFGIHLSQAGKWVVLLSGGVLILLSGTIMWTPGAAGAASERLEGGVQLVKPRPTPTSTPRPTPPPRPTTPASPTPTAPPPTATQILATTATGASTQSPRARATAPPLVGAVGAPGDSWLTTLWWGLGAAVLAVLALGAFLLVVARRVRPRL